jgi:hypothetical protein
MLNRFLMLLYAFCVLALLYLAIGWDLPITHAVQHGTSTNNEHTDADKNSGNSSPALGFVVRTFTSDAWDIFKRDHDEFIAAGTIFLAIFTFSLYLATKGLLKHAPKVERAYISGGGIHAFNVVPQYQFIAQRLAGGPLPPAEPRYEATGEFEFRVNNYGKTPGTVFLLEYGFCSESNIPAAPQYTPHRVDRPIGPGRENVVLARILITPIFADQVVYGRFHYSTIFGTKHSSGFIYRIEEWETPKSINAPDPFVRDEDYPT